MLFKHLKQMEQRPGMYGCENVDDIFKFTIGYSIALSEHNLEHADTDAEKFSSFTDFVLAYYKLPSSHHNWSGIIKYYSGSSSRESFDNFFKLFNEFIKIK